MKTLLKSFYRRIPLKRQAFEILRPLRLPHWLYQHFHFCGPFKVTMPGGSFRIWSYGDQVENDLFWTGFAGAWESTSLEAWRRLAQNATGAILDIGANTGVYALAARAVNAKSPITAYEPLRRVADRAAANFRLNGFDITVDVRAVSGHTGRARIYDNAEPNEYSASIEAAFPGCHESYEVPTVALDEVWETEPVSLIKLDVENHEPAAVRGMLNMLRRDKPALIVEVLTADEGRKLMNLLSSLDYRIFRVHERDGLIETDAIGPLEDHNWNNLLCTDEQFQLANLIELQARL